MKDFQKAIGKVRAQYKKRGQELFWIRNIERGTKGGWHIHLVVNEIGDTASILQKAWKKGGTWFTEIRKSKFYDEDFTKLANDKKRTYRGVKGGRNPGKAQDKRSELQHIPEHAPAGTGKADLGTLAKRTQTKERVLHSQNP